MNQKAGTVTAYSTLVEVRQALRAKQISATELVRLHIERIERLDGPINSIVVKNFEPALQAAAQADRRLAAGEARALEGVPISIKEAINVRGLVTSVGDPTYARATSASTTRPRYDGCARPAPSSSARPTCRPKWPTGRPSTRSTAAPTTSPRWSDAERAERIAALRSCNGDEFVDAQIEGLTCTGSQLFLWHLARERVRAAWRELFRDWDAMLCPAFHTPAFEHRAYEGPALGGAATHWRVKVSGVEVPYARGLYYPQVSTLAGQPALTGGPSDLLHWDPPIVQPPPEPAESERP